MAQIIEFPQGRVFRHPDLIDALEKLEMIDEYETSGDQLKIAVAGPMREFWEREFIRMGGVPRDQLKRDGVDHAAVEGKL
ncbi:hypothetical protein GCM10008023_19800 [Sphingomonas glacialis]|uniref:AbrB/MazE/SpoVT family DNA-binding domain-containing protein n=1 Tax=Sphingomonas glacialis TaxID=658225 RepID=A0ABQ3LJN2_9SPHN|nr:hypothetical protein [Sphingomonas glacialis]GHH16138.1 hypothetical protein GCM10008023_19800 [Sphingomonas glacialis]